MKTHLTTRLSPLLGLLCLALTVPAHAASKTDKDLQAVIALKGNDCGTVVSSKKMGSNDYIATCSNGKIYRVTADANGRVTVTQQ
jgi:hypothetical protein